MVSRAVRAALSSPQPIRAVLECDFALRLPPWSRLARDESTVAALRREATRVGSDSAFVRAACVAHGVYWPVRATIDACTEVARRGGRVRAAGGPTRRAQWLEALRLAHTMNYSPKTYYLYRFWDPAVRPTADTYLQISEMTALQVRLAGDASVIEDKERFADRCAELRIATPPVVAGVGGRQAERWTGPPGVLPACDLFVKRVRGQQGKGAELWRHDAAAGRWTRRGRTVGHDELLAHLRRSRRRLLVQPALRNHPDLDRFGTTLSTFRVMTLRDDDGSTAPIAIVLKMAREGSEVDNLHAGGFATAVDPETGRLGPGVTFDSTEGPQRRHPDTQAQVDGATVTCHRAAAALACRAHAALGLPGTVGWDVAVTPDGPMLLEGNPMWAIDLYHLPLARGLAPDLAERLLRDARRAG